MVVSREVALGELFDIGSSKRVFQSEWRNKGVPFYRAREIAKLASDGYVDNDLFIDEDLYVRYVKEYGKPMPGDIMVTGVGTLGVCYIVQDQDKFYFKDGNILWFRAKNTDKVLSEFVVRAFDSDYVKDEIRKNSSGTTVGTFTIQTAKQLKIRLPSMPDQRRIVDKLACVDKLILLRKKQLEKLDQLVKSRFIELFGDLKTNPYGWECKNLLDVAEIDTVMVSDYEKYADYPHIGIDGIEKNTGRLFGYRTIAEDGVISGKYLFTEKHIIYSKIRPNLNKVALPDFDGLCSADAYPILPKENICLRIYLGYVMRSEFFLDYILPFSRRANMPKVNKEQLSGFVLPVPNIELQQQFAAFVEQTEKSKLAIQQSLDKLELLKKSLMQEYFG